jgi:type 1 glutamine amidotransferase
MRSSFIRGAWVVFAACSDPTEQAASDSATVVTDTATAGTDTATAGTDTASPVDVPADSEPSSDADAQSPPDDVPEARDASFLVISRTSGYRHASIEDGQDALIALGAAEGVTMTLHPDSARLDPATLSPHDGLVLLSTTGDFLDDLEQESLVDFAQSGGRVLAIHAAADAEYDFPAYRALIGAAFARHPAIQAADVVVVADHPATSGLPARFSRTDEWYDWQALPDASGDRVVLLEVDETTYEGGGMGEKHPIAWVHTAGDGRVFYTGMGHTAASFQSDGGADELFLDHLRLGLEWLLAP